MSLVDTHGRKINYLRLSVTDRCNLRCTYCMPSRRDPKCHVGDLLSYEELLQLAEAAVAIGLEKIRITGGEPLIRKGIVNFMARVAQIPGLKRLVLTTNGILLPEMARDLREAGVQSLNVSLDSLDPGTFWRITRGGDLQRVLQGIAAAERAGYTSLKINMVVMRGTNHKEIADFAALTIENPYSVRFIEYMPTAADSGVSLTVPGSEVLAALARRYRLYPVEREPLGGPSTSYRIDGARGTIGVITPLSCHFCHDCNRIRITSSGIAKSCLFASEPYDLKPAISSGDTSALQEALQNVVKGKPLRHDIYLNQAAHNSSLHMSGVGG